MNVRLHIAIKDYHANFTSDLKRIYTIYYSTLYLLCDLSIVEISNCQFVMQVTYFFTNYIFIIILILFILSNLGVVEKL
jgi:hypothetical protein